MYNLTGLAESTSGVVKMDGVAARGTGPDRGVVFQNDPPLPWLSTLRNVTFDVAARHVPPLCLCFALRP